MVQRSALAFVIAATACGGAVKSSSAPANSGGTPVSAPAIPAPWGNVLVEGATFTLDNRPPDMPATGEEELRTLTVSVHDVTATGDATRARLVLAYADGVEETGGWPMHVQVSPAGVWLGPEEPDELFAGPPTFPAGAAKTTGGGYVYTVDAPADADGLVCYGWEPDAAAGPCADVCTASICLEPRNGIVSGMGVWWPGNELYQLVEEVP